MNERLFNLINSWAGRSDWLDHLMVFSAEWLGYGLIGILLALAYLNRQKYLDMAIVAFGAAVFGRFFVVSLVRYFYENPRPFLVLDKMNQLVEHEASASFPSGHATFYSALAFGVFIYNKKLGSVFLVCALLIGFARIFVGVHWPLDVLAGFLVGGLSAFAGYLILNKIKSHLNEVGKRLSEPGKN